MKKTVRIVNTLLIVLAILCIASNVTLALTPGDITIDNSNGTDDITTIGGKIIGVIRTVGIVISVAMIAILGVKFMIGSAEEKAKYKESMIPYVVGAVLLFAASAIAGAVYNFSTGIAG